MTEPATGSAGVDAVPVEVPDTDYREQHAAAVAPVADPEQPITAPDPVTAVAEGDPEADPADVAEQATPVGVDGDDPDGYPPAV